MTTRSGPARRAKAPAPKAGAAAGDGPSLDHGALLAALRDLMQPLAALSVARGLPFATVEELLKSAFVDAAQAAHSAMASQRVVSRISAVTGLSRREVSRLMHAEADAVPTRRSPATQVFTRWVAEPSLQTRNGEPMPLRRQGPAPSFEELARSVTRDVHPRSLLDELCRLGLTRLKGDIVHVTRERFVPSGDAERMLGFLASNVGDHLRAAVDNVLVETPQHLEQAVFADELSPESLEELDAVMRAQWRTLLSATVPLLHRLIDADRHAKRVRDQRVRVGLYMFSDAMGRPAKVAESKVPAARKSVGRAKRGQ